MPSFRELTGNLKICDDISNQVAKSGTIHVDIDNNQIILHDGMTPGGIALGGSYLALAGGTLTGQVFAAADPTQPLGLSTKQYTDSAVTRAGGPFLSLAGGTVTGSTTFNFVTKFQYPPTITAPMHTTGGTLNGYSVGLVLNAAAGSFAGAAIVFGPDPNFPASILNWMVYRITDQLYFGTVDSGGNDIDIMLIGPTGIQLKTSTTLSSTLRVNGNVGFNNTAPIAKPTITGAKGGNTALAALLTALASYGLIVDSSSA